MKVVIAGGGTAGHVFPAIALAQELTEQHGADVGFIGTERGLEARLVPEAGFDLHLIDALPFRRSISLDLVKAPVALMRSISTCKPLIADADVVVGVGGYVSGPPVAAALRAHRPVVLHEQNAIPGAANRFFSGRADEVALSFAEARSKLSSRAHTVVTGNPVRRAIRDLGERRETLRTEGLAFLKLDPRRFTVLVFGGSQGAKHLNEVFVEALATLLEARDDLQAVLLTGRDHADAMRARAGDLRERGLVLLPFLERMELAYACSDLIVSRAGATTIAEITACGLPSILVPYPHATANHQEANARAVERAGGAEVLADATLSATGLAGQVERLLADEPRRVAMAAAATGFGRPDAARALAEVVVAHATQRGGETE
jgi:UDP-N-acetylglucosamine--N-acetylmuramyl-(pentapeptide) pyrophosphoryl-undecaprenol N-acetylglucosamine transferase